MGQEGRQARAHRSVAWLSRFDDPVTLRRTEQIADRAGLLMIRPVFYYLSGGGKFMKDQIEGVHMPVQFEKARLNLWNAGGFAILLVVNSFALGGVYISITKDLASVQVDANNERQARKDRGLQTDSRFTAIENKIPQFEVVAQQIAQLTALAARNEKAIELTNERFSRYVETNSGKLDNLLSRMAEVSADLKVVQSQLTRNDSQRTQRTRVETLELRGIK